MLHPRFAVAPVAVILAATLSATLSAQQFQDLTRMSVTTDVDNAFGIATGDVNRDGACDYFMTNTSSGQSSKLYLNDGNGNFTDASAKWLPSSMPPGGAAAMGDLNGDTFLDIIHGTTVPRGAQLLLYDLRSQKYVDASKNLSPQPTALYYDIKLGDVDFDKDLDLLLVATTASGSALYINDGKGNFKAAPASQFPAVPGSWGATFIDLDRDVDLDIVIHNNGTPTVLRNTNFKGTYSNVTTTVVPSSFTNTGQRKVVAGDFNGDGWQDLFFGNYNSQNKLLLWDIKSRKFVDATSSNLPVNSDGSYMLAMGDVDQDGDLDVLSGNWAGGAGAQNTYYLNDGKGKFTEESGKRWKSKLDGTTVIALADVDQDGDLDAIIGNWVQQNRVAFNTHRHVYAPNPPQINTTYTLEFWGKPGYATLPQVIVPLIGVAEAKPHITVATFEGRLGIPLAGVIILPSVALAAPGGNFAAKFPIPNNSTLKGLQFYVQSLMAQPPNPVAGFANLFGDKIQ